MCNPFITDKAELQVLTGKISKMQRMGEVQHHGTLIFIVNFTTCKFDVFTRDSN